MNYFLCNNKINEIVPLFYCVVLKLFSGVYSIRIKATILMHFTLRFIFLFLTKYPFGEHHPSLAVSLSCFY